MFHQHAPMCLTPAMLYAEDPKMTKCKHQIVGSFAETWKIRSQCDFMLV